MLAERIPELTKAVGLLQELSQNEETRILYEAREKMKRDEKSKINFAAKQGEEKGLAKGLAKGKVEEKQAMVRKLLARGQSLDFIQDVSGLSVDDIKKLM